MRRLMPWRKRSRTGDPSISDPQPHTETEHARPSPESSPPVAFPDGAKVLYDCPGATVDICFIHGLTGDRDSTWTAYGQSTPWPKTLLPPKLSKARILTYGYDAYVVRKSVASVNRLIDHATNLLNDLTTDRVCCNASSRPLIFVTHSLGGLVCKEAILLSRNNPDNHLRSIFDCMKGIIFMGTPHKGAWMADWAKIPASAIGLVKSTNKSLLEILETNDQLLESIQVSFLAMIREQREDGRPLEVTCFYEELPLPGAGTVVSKESAVLEGYNPMTIHANHRDMVKFASAEENGFKRLLGELVRWESQVVHHLSTTVPKPSQDCLKSLAFLEMQSRFHGIKRPVPGTCEWLLRHETYRTWAVRDRGLLWIKGKPGSGKSTLLRYALDNHEAGRSDLVLSFFFHGRGEALQKTPLGLFRSLLHQILGQAPDALLDLVDTFEKRRKEIGEPDERWQWHQEELQRFFDLCLPRVLKTRSVWLFVDALDECGRRNAVDLVQYFKSLLKSLPPPSIGLGQFYICFACRPYPILDLDSGFEICPDTENGEDISTFVDDRLSAFRIRTSSTIPALITDCACGVFMWASLVVERVLDLEYEGAGLKKIEAAVRSIPPDLDELYKELIRDMGSASLKLIQWICFATRPLSTDELPWAMVIEADCPHRSLRECLSAEEFPDNVRMKRQIRTLSCGLAEVTHAQIVQFIHQSVKDFFLEKGLLALDSSASIDSAIGMAHFRLSRICIRYLSMEEIGRSTSYNSNDLASKFPFLRYATTSWVAHMTQSNARSVAQEDLLELFAWPSHALVELWVRVFMIVEGYSPSCPQEGTSLVHVISRYGVLGPLTTILQTADQNTTGIDSKDERGRTPLSWAAGNGHDAVVKLLLDKGEVEVDLKDEQDRTPLWWAARNGHDAVVKLLLNTGRVEVNLKDIGWDRTPLWWAARNGHDAVVKLLLDTGKVEVNLKDTVWDRTPLSWAAENGHDAVVKLLLGKGKAEVNLRDILLDRTPLWWAAENGHDAVVKLLLDTGKVEVNVIDKLGRTPLSWAAGNGHDAVAKLLLRTGKIKVDLKDQEGRTPLSWAAENGHKAVVKQLLDIAKVEVDSKDRRGRTPLSWAAGGGHKAVAKLLQG